jgi:hypothetical protein
MKKISFMAQKVKSTFCGLLAVQIAELERATHVVGVVLLQDPAPALIHVLVALSATAHAQCRVHVHIMTRQVQRNEALEDDAPTGECLRQEDEQTRCCAPVRDHIQHCTKLCRLIETASRVPIEGIEQT